MHLIAEKDRTQDELFVLFNLLIEAGRQLVFTSAVPLAELTGVEPRLRTRLEGGLVVELPAPDRESGERVLERELEAKLGAADAELAAYLASRPADSIRARAGAAAAGARAPPRRKGVPPSAGARARGARGPPAAPPRRAGPPARSSGVVAAGAAATRSREKMVWEWPEVGERVIEEWR